MGLTDTSEFPLHMLKRWDLTLLRLRCLCWAVLVSVSLTVCPTQKAFSVAVQHAELYLDLLFLWLNSLLQVSAFGKEWDYRCVELVQVLCFWSAQAVSH